MLMRMNNVRRIRKTLFRVSQTKFGEIAGVTQATVSRWETGLLAPSLLELDRIRASARKQGLKLKAEDFFAPVAAPSEERAA